MATPLYKYMTRSSLLEDRFIRFTPPSELNDPRECRPAAEFRNVDAYIDSIILRNLPSAALLVAADRAGQPPEEILTTLTAAAEQIRAEYKRDPDALLESAYDIYLKHLNRTVGVLSLSEEPLSTAMWAHYGDEQRGICLEFDSTCSFFSPRANDMKGCGELKPISYSANRPVMYLDSDFIDIPLDAFFWKTLDWQYEREWRLIRRLATADQEVGDGVHLFQLPPNAITRVILGSTCDAAFAQECRDRAATGFPAATFATIEVDQAGDLAIRDI